VKASLLAMKLVAKIAELYEDGKISEETMIEYCGECDEDGYIEYDVANGEKLFPYAVRKKCNHIF